MATCFLPYYGFPGGRSVSRYDQLLVAQDGGLELGAVLFLFGGVATVLVVAIVGLTRSERPSGRAFLAGAVAAWSLTWIGVLLQTANLREGAIGELSLEIGFWLQAVSIGVAVIGTILAGLGSAARSRTATTGMRTRRESTRTRDAGHVPHTCRCAPAQEYSFGPTPEPGVGGGVSGRRSRHGGAPGRGAAFGGRS